MDAIAKYRFWLEEEINKSRTSGSNNVTGLMYAKHKFKELFPLPDKVFCEVGECVCEADGQVGGKWLCNDHLTQVAEQRRNND